MLIEILVVTIKKIALDYTLKKMRKEFKHFPIKKLNTKDNGN